MQPTAILIDLYGTLVHEDPAYPSVSTFLRSRGILLAPEKHMSFWTEDIDGHDHTKYSSTRTAFKAWARSRRAEMLSSVGTPVERQAQVLDEFETWDLRLPWKPYPEAVSVLKHLGNIGIRRVIASNWSWDIDAALEMAGISELVDAVACSARVGYRKPHPAFYRAALSAAGAEAHSTIFVGDNWIDDVQGPMRFGIQPIHLARLQDIKKQQFERGPDSTTTLRINSLRELVRIVS
jgi:HAD superfamily hydrolase (TIGR01549 family)